MDALIAQLYAIARQMYRTEHRTDICCFEVLICK